MDIASDLVAQTPIVEEVGNGLVTAAQTEQKGQKTTVADVVTQVMSLMSDANKVAKGDQDLDN